MPTAPKLVAALWFAALAWFASNLVDPYLPEGMPTDMMHKVCAAFGALTGWLFMGRRAGDTMAAAYGYGLTTSAIIAFWSVFWFAGDEMLQRALATRYDDPVKAISAFLGFVKDYAILIAKWDIIIVAVVGGLFGGWLVERVAARWS